MTTLFVLLFVVSVIAIGISLSFGSVSQLGLFAAGMSGLLALFGVGTLYFSANVEK
jgi:hypothetical protein